MTIPAANEGMIYVGIQTLKGTPQTTLYKMYLTEFNWEPDVVQDEGEAVIGRGLDVDTVERYGFNGATIRGAMRFRPGNVGYLLQGFGLDLATAGTDPYQHTFTPFATPSSFPYLTILDKFDGAATLDVLLSDIWLNSLTITANERDALRLEFEGRALNFTTTIGAPTLNDESAGLVTPNTAKGTLTLDAAAYKLNSLSLNLAWGEALATSLTDPVLEQVIVQGRNVTGNADAFLGAESGLFEDVYMNGGATPSTALFTGDLDAKFESGAEPLTGPAPYYVQLALAETRFLTYPLGQSGDDPVRGGLTFQVTRETTDWEIIIQNAMATYP